MKALKRLRGENPSKIDKGIADLVDKIVKHLIFKSSDPVDHIIIRCSDGKLCTLGGIIISEEGRKVFAEEYEKQTKELLENDWELVQVPLEGVSDPLPSENA